MAGVLKVRDAGGVLRTITAAKVRDAGGVLRTLQFIRVRDAGGVLREVFTAGGGGASNPASIAPGSQSFSGTGPYKSAMFTAMSSGAAPTSFTWGLLDGDGSVISGGSTATATLQAHAAAGDDIVSTFFCDMVIGGATYRATCQLAYANARSGGGGTQ